MVMEHDFSGGKMGTNVKIPELTKLLDRQLLYLQLLFVMQPFALQDTYNQPLPALVGTRIFALDLNMIRCWSLICLYL